MKVVIIEDEKLSAEHLSVLLQKIDTSITVIKYFDTITMNMKLKEIIFVTSKSSPLPDAPQNGGNKNAGPATKTQTDEGNKTGGESVLHSWFGGH